MKTFIAIAIFLLLGSSTFAQECLTKDKLTTSILTTNPNAVVVINEEKVILFSAPNLPTDLMVTFDEKGCLFSAVELPRKAPTT